MWRERADGSIVERKKIPIISFQKGTQTGNNWSNTIQVVFYNRPLNLVCCWVAVQLTCVQLRLVNFNSLTLLPETSLISGIYI